MSLQRFAIGPKRASGYLQPDGSYGPRDTALMSAKWREAEGKGSSGIMKENANEFFLLVKGCKKGGLF